MSFTVEDCLKLPSLRSGRVIAGEEGLSRMVNTISVIEVVDNNMLQSDNSIDNREICITSFFSVKDDIDSQCQVVEHMSNTGAACIVLYYVGVYVKSVSQRVIDVANHLKFPIIMMPENRMNFLYSEVISEVTDALRRDRNNNKNFIDKITTLVSLLPENKKTISNLMRIISDNLKCTLLLSDSSLNHMRISKWPVYNEISADIIHDLYEKSSSKKEFCVETLYNDLPLNIYKVPFTAFEYRNFSLFVADAFGTLTLVDLYQVIEILQIFSKLWDNDYNNILANDLVPAIIDGDEDKMRNISKRLQIDINSINTTLIIRPNWRIHNMTQQYEIKRKMIKKIKDCSEAFGKKIIIDTYNLYVICFIMFSHINDSDKDYIEEIKKILYDIDSDSTISLFANDGTVKEVRETYLLYAENVKATTTIFPHKIELSYGDILFACQCKKMVEGNSNDFRICYNIIKPLLKCKEREDLLNTLAIYHLDNNEQIKKTAQQLYLHRNTVQYRLNKIKEITNFTVDNNLNEYIIRAAIACYRLSPELFQS